MKWSLSIFCLLVAAALLLVSTVDLASAQGAVAVESDTSTTTTPESTETASDDAESQASPEIKEEITVEDNHPVQTGPLIDLFGPVLLSLEMVDESTAQLQPHFTTDALRGKRVIGVYFSADWCGPCRQFTPELVGFYDRMNRRRRGRRRGGSGEFEIVWVSRCRDVDSYGQYFTHMGGWYALPPEEAMGERGAVLSEKYKVKGIPTLVLLDDMGSVITRDARNLIPKDKAGIGFPWRNPVASVYMALVPRSLRLMVRSQIGSAKDKLLARVKQVVRPSKTKAQA